jgi:zinc D-Ala-D-Ala carboxypeptidase
MNLSPNFSFEELTRTENRDLLQKNLGMANDPAILANLTRVATELLEPIRALVKQPMQITSGYRCPELNARVGGSSTSQHVQGEAADFVVKGFESQEQEVALVTRIVRELPGLKWGQLLVESGCIHVSLGTKKEVAYYDVPTKTKKVFTV